MEVGGTLHSGTLEAYWGAQTLLTQKRIDHLQFGLILRSRWTPIVVLGLVAYSQNVRALKHYPY